MKNDEVGAGVLCVITSLGALGIYMFDFARQPLSIESLFWAMPMICPIAFAVYLRSKRFGAVVQMLLYVMAMIGAYHLIQEDCRLGNCSTRNVIAMAMASVFSGPHLIAMLADTVLMCMPVKKTLRHT